MDFAVFVLLNALLFIRPMEFVPALYGLPLFNLTFCLCFMLSLPSLLSKGVLGSIIVHPISLCVIAMTATAVVSSLANYGIEAAGETFDVMVKIVLYYLLLVVVMRTPRRLQWFLGSIVVDSCIIALLGIGDYKGYFKIPGLYMVEEARYVDGQEIPFRRLGSTGLFGDPNDLSLLLVGCMVNSLYLATDRRLCIPVRTLWLLLPLPILFQALLLTYSRAGMLTLLVAGTIGLIARFRWRALIPILLALPAVAGAGGRQMEFTLFSGTGQSRVALWDAHFGNFASNPVFGVGFGHCMDSVVQVVHNSYLHAFVELGYFGGTAFLGAVLLSFLTLLRIGPLRTRGLDKEMSRLWCFLLAGVGCYAFGIMSLSRCYVIPTFTTLGLATAYERIALATAPQRRIRLGLKTAAAIWLASISFLLIMFLLIKNAANYY